MSNSLTPPADDAFHHFIATPLDTLLAEHHAINPKDNVLALFHRCVAEVHAYCRFLEARGETPAEITSFPTFRGLPLIGKADYIQFYPLPLRHSLRFRPGGGIFWLQESADFLGAFRPA